MPETGQNLSQTDKQLLDKICKWKTESGDLRSELDRRWTKSMKLVKGIWSSDEPSKSHVRQKEKTCYRKIHAIKWRFMAAMYQAFLKDLDSFKISGRDTLRDTHKASILQLITEWRRDGMLRTQSLFKQLLCGFANIFDMGVAVAKMTWEYLPEQGKDGPRFKLWPNEQFYPDFFAETKEEMRYCIFESFMTKEDMEAKNYDNIEKALATLPPQSDVRAVRQAGQPDTLQNPQNTEYPEAGKYAEGNKDIVPARHSVLEVFYKEDNKIMFTVVNGDNVVLQQPDESPYGDTYDMLIIGECLLEAHKLIGEDFPSPMEGSAESINYFLNMRKDNIALTLSPQKRVNRFANVDLKALLNQKAGGIVMMDDIDKSTMPEITPDVTRPAYMEAAADEAMMQEISGFTPPISGTIGADIKATVARINYAEANAKIELYIAIVGETFIRDFFSTLARLIQRFETDETIFSIANDTFRQKQQNPFIPDQYDLDFEADCIINVGTSIVGRELEIQQLLLVMDRANMANQSSIQLLTIGAQPPGGVELFNTNYFLKKILNKIGQKDYSEAIYRLSPPPQQGQGGQNPSIAGLGQPQIGGRETLAGLGQPQIGGRETLAGLGQPQIGGRETL